MSAILSSSHLSGLYEYVGPAIIWMFGVNVHFKLNAFWVLCKVQHRKVQS